MRRKPDDNDGSDSSEVDPAWSPDGKLIVYSWTDETLNPRESDGRILRAWEVDGRYNWDLCWEYGYWPSYPAWSPDGKHISFSRISEKSNDQDMDNEYRIMLINPDGESEGALTKYEGKPGSPLADPTEAPSPAAVTSNPGGPRTALAWPSCGTRTHPPTRTSRARSISSTPTGRA